MVHRVDETDEEKRTNGEARDKEGAEKASVVVRLKKLLSRKKTIKKERASLARRRTEQGPDSFFLSSPVAYLSKNSPCSTVCGTIRALSLLCGIEISGIGGLTAFPSPPPFSPHTHSISNLSLASHSKEGYFRRSLRNYLQRAECRR